MKDKCIDAVASALGREVTKAEAQKIEDRLREKMRFISANDPQAFMNMSPSQRLYLAAEEAAKDLISEAELAKKRIELTIQKHDALDEYISEQADKGMNGMDALERKLVFVADAKSDTLSAETVGNSIRANSIRNLVDTFQAVGPKFWGLFEDVEGIKQLTRAIFGEKTDNPAADKGAKAWLETANALRNQFVDAGGKIGKLEDWALPQHHSELKVGKAGMTQWVRDVFPALNRKKYVDDAGFPMGDNAVIELLQSAYMSIATGGVNQMTPGAMGQSMLANRRAHHREIHFKDADAYLNYQEKYGEKSLWGVMTNHVDGLSKELSMLETFGPNPDATFRLFLEKQYQQAVTSSPADKAKTSIKAKKLANLYDFVSNNTQPVVNETMAKGFDTLRNWLVSSRLGSAVITSIADEATLHLTANVNNLPEIQLFRNEISALNPADQTEANLAHRAGLGLDTMIGHLNRWGQDNLGPTFTSKMSSTVMRASGMEALDGARRRAFGVTYMSALGEMTQKYGSLADLDKTDHKILLSKGITEGDWAIWKQAELEQWGAGNGVLTPESIMQIAGVSDTAKRNAVLKLLGVVLEETDMAVIRPGAKDKFLTGGGMEKGTWKGELTRSFFLFKSFPIAMISRHFLRGMTMDTAGGKALYLAKLIAGTTVLGAAAQTVNDLLSGKNPRNYNPAEEHGVKNWIGAMLKGGSLGLYGDFLFSDTTQYGNSPITSVLGPVSSLAESALGLTQGNIMQAAHGQETHAGAEAVKFIKGNLPGANLWYAKAALDHLVFQQMQEYFSPGYLSRVQSRAQKEFGQSYFWQPGAGIDKINPPDLTKAVGQ